MTVINVILGEEDMRMVRLVVLSVGGIVTFLLGFMFYWCVMALAFLVSVL